MGEVIFSVDAETVGLYGEHFAIGWSLRSVATGEEIDHGYEACSSSNANGDDDDREWISKNVLPKLPPQTTADNPSQLYEKFWAIWMDTKKNYDKVHCVADCGFPVESRLFENCVKLDHSKRKFDGPYPLNEVETMLGAAKLDRDSIPLNHDEILTHHPTHDARRSGRLYYRALKKLQEH